MSDTLQPPPEPETRVCGVCGETRPAVFFGADPVAGVPMTRACAALFSRELESLLEEQGCPTGGLGQYEALALQAVRTRCRSNTETPIETHYRRQARALYAVPGECEIDDNAEVSLSETGAFVQAWLWVGADEDEPSETPVE